MTSKAELLMRPIIGIENRTAQEVFDIMCDRFNSLPDEPAPRGYPFQEPGHIDFDAPSNEDEAAAMAILATNWLEKNAPHRLQSNRLAIVPAPSPTKPEGAFDTSDYVIIGHDGVPRRNTTKPEGLEWRHLKRGTVYTEIGRGRMQCSTEFAADDEDVVIYRGQDGAIWVRLVKEFEDGRFERLSPVSDTTDTVRVKREDALDDTPLERCHADRDGDCNHPNCPQLRDNEPHTTGRHCPIDTWKDADQ